MTIRSWLVTALVIGAVACSGASEPSGVDAARKDGGRDGCVQGCDGDAAGADADAAGGDAAGGDAAGGDGGAAGAVLAIVEVRNSTATARLEELAWSGIPLSRSAGVRDPSGLQLRRQGVQHPAQFRVLSRWGAPVDDATAPIRWLGVALPVSLAGQASQSFSILAQTPAPDPQALHLAQTGTTYAIDTGRAKFTLDGQTPGLFSSIDLTPTAGTVERIFTYAASQQAGPVLTLDDGTVLDNVSKRILLATDATFVADAGPVRVEIVQVGHFTHPTHPQVRLDCSGQGTPYERFGYTLALTFQRDSSEVLVRFNFRNECSDASGASWTDQAVRVREVKFVLPLVPAGREARLAGSGSWHTAPAGFAGVAHVEQIKGDSGTWQGRSARVRLGTTTLESMTAADQPFLALRGPTNSLVFVTMPWLRYREPQALLATTDSIAFAPVSEPLIVGEGKAIWSVAKLGFYPSGSQATTAALDGARGRALAELERGLLVRRSLADFNSTGVLPSLGTASTNLVTQRYQQYIQQAHTDTIKATGLWEAIKSYGSQLWPEARGNVQTGSLARPEQNPSSMNYWNPAGAELLEYLRMGDASYAWDFALPQIYLQMYTAYLNVHERPDGGRNGLAVNSGGTGEGQWHRSNFGSDDYAYNKGVEYAYAIRPDPLLLDRLRQAGRTIVGRYWSTKAQEAARDPYLDTRGITRGVFQHVDMLLNCAEFVPGAPGQACHNKLVEMMAEFTADNLAPGVLCQADVPTNNSCSTPQQFMQNALMFWTFLRYHGNYEGPQGPVGHALVRAAQAYYRFGMGKLANNRDIDAGACWAAGQRCTLAAGRSDVTCCEARADSDGNLCIYGHNRAHGLAVLLAASAIDPAAGLCTVSKKALDQATIYAPIADYVGAGNGWWKGLAQAYQGFVFAVGGYDACSDTAAPPTGPTGPVEQQTCP